MLRHLGGKSDAADYNSVVIWCKKFNVEIGRAMFESDAMMMK